MIKIEISSEQVSGLISFYESELAKALTKVDEIKATLGQLKGQKVTTTAPAPAVAAAPAKGKRGRPPRAKVAEKLEAIPAKVPGKRGRKPKVVTEQVTKVVEGPKGRPGRKPKPVPAWTSEVGSFLHSFMESQMDTFTTNDLKRVVYNHFNANASEERAIADKYLVEALKSLSSQGVLNKYKDLGSKENKYVFYREM